MGDHNRSTRRDFLKTVSVAAAAFAAPLAIPSRALGAADTPPPSDRIVMGGIGLGNMGSGDMGAFSGNGSVQYVAVCDVRKDVLADRKGRIDQRYGNGDCTAYGDFRDLLARTDIDAVHIATPDHWHAIMIIEACRNGKDVYCQKPETLTLREGRLVVDAARRYKRVVSGGSQRVLEDYRGHLERCWGGELGTIKSINVVTRNFSSVCNLPEEPVPETMDWNMWLGPAPWAPYNGNRCSGRYDTGGNAWRAYNDYSGGDITDWGAHHFGGATFVADVRDLQPAKVTYNPTGGAPHISFEYPNGVVLHSCRPGTGQFHIEGTPGEKLAPKPIPSYADSKGRGGRGSIYGDFLECVKTGGRPFRDIEWAVNTMAVCHLATVANTLRRSLVWDAAKQEFPGDAEANRLVDRARREPWYL
jgi:predicted dehydrogenase